MEKQKRTKSQISEMIQGYGFITPALNHFSLLCFSDSFRCIFILQ